MQSITLEFVPGGVQPIVRVSQYDKTLRTFEVEMVMEGQPYEVADDHRILISGTKPDGKSFEYVCAFEANVVTVVVTEQMSAAHGNVACELTVYDGDDNRISSANFILRATISKDNGYVLLFVLELILLILWMQVLALLIFAVFRVHRDLLIPMRNLSSTLKKYRAASPETLAVSGDEDENVRETIDDAYTILHEMEHNVNDLSTQLYEKEIENQKVQLNFRNLQIRPHFIINCFAMLSGMAQVSGNKEIKDTVIELSEYFRYILHDSMDMVTLNEEIGHIHTLVEIRSRIRGCRIEFSEDVSDEAKGEKVPALLLGSLAENSIRYSANSEGGIRIRLSGGKEDERLVITFVDNGPGIQQELMDEINNSAWERESNGHHIGISNMLERLKLIYGGRAEVRFARDDGDYGGTRVWIAIPLNADEEDN